MPGGRPTKYKPEYCLVVEALARLGWTDAQMAEKLGVSMSTFSLWKTEYPEFSEALRIGKEPSDERVERSLYRMATGYRHMVKKPMEVKDGGGTSHIEIIEYEEHIAPNPTSMIFWLKNRRPDRWRDKQEVEVDSTVEIKHSFDPEGV